MYDENYSDSRDEHRYDRDRGRSRSPRREGRGRYTDRDKEGYRSPRRDRSRSRSPYFGGTPNRNVILEGLPAHFTQEDILHELQHSLRVEGLEEVRLIKGKKTGQSRQFAFAQFASVDDAREFLEHHYPNLTLYGPYDPTQAATAQPAKVRIAYSREREERDKAGKSEEDWKCEVCYLPNFAHRTLCFRCNAPRTRSSAHGVVLGQANISSYSGFATTGDSDASPDETASQFLLLRGLEPGVNEELLAKGVIKLYKTKAGTPPKDTHTTKKTKIASTSNDSSLGAKEGSLRRVLLVRDRKSDDSWRYGFAEFNTVEDAQAAVAKYKALDRFTISSKPVMVSYIHAGVFVPVPNPSSNETGRFTFSPLLNSAMKLMYWDEAAYVSEQTITPVEQPSKAKLQEAEASKRAAAAANEGLVGGPTRDVEPRSKKRKVEKENKVVAPHLQFWSDRHAEIHGIPSKDPEDLAFESTAVSSKSKEKDDTHSPPTQSFADMTRKCCLLCARQFKTDAEVNKHERISQLHRDNMKNEELVTKAMAKLNKTIDLADNSAYRDRAKERRQAFNQPKQPAAQHNRDPKSSIVIKALSKEKEPEEPVQSKGAALLGKMGWSAGEGLGAQGTGRTSAITTDLYSAGVGLGAQGGKLGDAVEEAQRQTTSSYADFLNKTKDKAKERFHSLN
ncbi:hypothetical protein BJ875DRAFT_471033 [Amylocarpus encephaloides]|uniref:RNA-binding protein n=1 Tax=Amylocarpus encephaloides TaxID=45428 RepID=A0A9P8C3C1_9HELO|nr:hypothetical protein BJ875DRAFT_471033 [Amylocarpus encephaloides]